MLFKTVAVFFLIVFWMRAAAQKTNPTDSTKKVTDSAALAKIETRLDQIFSLIGKTRDANDETTGALYYKKLVPVYTGNRKPAGYSIIVDSIYLLIADGYVVDVQVHAQGREFTNTRAPISINDKRFSFLGGRTDRLENKYNGNEFIWLPDCLRYQARTLFSPDDAKFWMTKPDSLYLLSKAVGINTVLDLRLYTDALGSLGDEPNGIVLTDLRFKQFLHRLHYANSGFKIFHYFKLNLTAAKFDSKYSSIDSTALLSRLSLMQRSKLQITGILNILAGYIGTKTLNNYTLDMGAGFGNVNLSRPTLKDTITIKTQTLFIELGASFHVSSFAGFDFSTRLGSIYSPDTEFDKQRKGVRYFRFGGEVYWNPFNDRANRLFARILYTKGLTSFDNKSSFSQVQLGYSTLLSKAIGERKSN